MEPIKWYSIEEVAKHLSMSDDTILKLIKTKKLPAHKLGKLWRFDIQAVDKWVKEQGDGSN